jgi:hypothetical protein
MRHRQVASLLLAPLLLAVALAPGELRGGKIDDSLYVVVLSIGETADPIVSWEPVDEWDSGAGKPMNPPGATKGDGRPDVAFDPTSGWPLVTWSSWSGTDYDVAVAEWEGEDWSETQFVVTNLENQLDPRSHIDYAGRVRTVWWEPVQVGKLYMAVREPGAASWGSPVSLSRAGRRPSVTMDGADLLVGYEADGPHGTQKVIMLTGYFDGSSKEETLCTTVRLDPLDVMVHEANGVVWADWKQTDEAFAYSVRTVGDWTDPVLVPWSDHSWSGELELRELIRDAVLNP